MRTGILVLGEAVAPVRTGILVLGGAVAPVRTGKLVLGGAVAPVRTGILVLGGACARICSWQRMRLQNKIIKNSQDRYLRTLDLQQKIARRAFISIENGLPSRSINPVRGFTIENATRNCSVEHPLLGSIWAGRSISIDMDGLRAICFE